MELGERIRQARLDAGLSQRQLSEPQITRNMLSRIEHGAVQPSMQTLQYLAGRLQKPVGWFLGEEAEASRESAWLQNARTSFSRGEFRQVLDSLEQGNPWEWETALLECLSAMYLAKEAIRQNRIPYAEELLNRSLRAGQRCPYVTTAIKRELVLLQYQAGGDPDELAQKLPDDDRELLLRAKAALVNGETEQAAACLEAATDKETALWFLLRGDCHRCAGDYTEAVSCYRMAEAAYPRETVSALEICYRELGDYKRAYEYACRQKR